MSDRLAARAMLAWFFQNLEPGQNPVDFIGGAQAHLQGKGLALPSAITTEHLGDPDAFMAQLEVAAEIVDTLWLQSWVRWYDNNSYETYERELQELIADGVLPWHLHPHKDDQATLCQVIRALPL